MPILIIIGLCIAAAGLIALMYCILKAISVRNSDNTEMANAVLQKLILINYAALAVATLGVCMVIIGMIL